MKSLRFWTGLGLAGQVLVVLGALGIEPAAAASSPQLPRDFSEVEQVVRAYFQGLDDYQPGDLITRRQVEPLLGRSEFAWLQAERTAILGSLLQDGDFLTAELRSSAGRKFMKQIASYPNSLDRLERLSRLPQGKKTVRNLVQVRDGYKLIEYMTTKPGGTSLGGVLSKSAEGANFNKPTGRIYTVESLLVRLKQSYQAKVGKAVGVGR